MNEANGHALALSLEYAYFRQDDPAWFGYARTLEDAQLACQGAAAGGLRWAGEPRSWIAHDLETGALYVIDHLPF